MPHHQPASLAQLTANYTPEKYLSTLRSCANSRTSAETLSDIYADFFTNDKDWSKTGMTIDDLSKIMAFKLSRGKWRPRLQQMIESNDADAVVSVTKEAAQSSDLKERMSVLCQLKAVGPATASLILTIMDKAVPFYSDEFAAFHLGDGKLKYNLKEYLTLIETHDSWLEQELAKKENKDVKVTARQVEEMIWLWSRGERSEEEDATAKRSASAGEDDIKDDNVKKRKKK